MRIATFAVVLLACSAAFGAGERDDGEAKAVAGISIVGNNEAPKSLYIVPWKGSETGANEQMKSGLMDESIAPLDRDVFMRQLDYHELSKSD